MILSAIQILYGSHNKDAEAASRHICFKVASVILLFCLRPNVFVKKSGEDINLRKAKWRADITGN